MIAQNWSDVPTSRSSRPPPEPRGQAWDSFSPSTSRRSQLCQLMSNIWLPELGECPFLLSYETQVWRHVMATRGDESDGIVVSAVLVK